MTDQMKQNLELVRSAVKSGRLETYMSADTKVQKSWGPAMRR